MIVLKPEDEGSILQFEKSKLDSLNLDPIELELSAWHASWRQESLRHYLRLGWSFGVWSDDGQEQLLGYLLAQPFLFFRGFTQTLWVEHMGWSQPEALDVLIEIAFKWSKDKHLQKVIFHANETIQKHLQPYGPSRIEENLLELTTAKIR